jgi:hypothetical protein
MGRPASEAGPVLTKQKKPSARQLVRQDGGVTAPRAGRGRPGWPMAAHQLASAYKKRSSHGSAPAPFTKGRSVLMQWQFHDLSGTG